jgi:ABC-type Mn2+/Zn2+ transport system permease subunit
MLFSLVCNPAAAALLVARGVGRALAWAAGFGIAGALGGFALAYWFDWPAGACIAIVSALPFVLAAATRRHAS